MVTHLRDVHDLARRGTPRSIAVAWPHDEDVLVSLARAAGEGLVQPLLVGQRSVIETIRGHAGLSRFEAGIVECATDADAVEVAVRKVAGGEAQMLMKGLVSTSVFLRGVLNKEWGLRKRPLLSHVAVFEFPDPTRLVLVTDVAMNIAPDLAQKVQILENAVDLARRLGFDRPRIAALAAVETVGADMPATIDAAVLSKMADRGQIKGCVIDGPLALDNALAGRGGPPQGDHESRGGVRGHPAGARHRSRQCPVQGVGAGREAPRGSRDRGGQRAGGAHVAGRFRRGQVPLDRACRRHIVSGHRAVSGRARRAGSSVSD